MDFIQVLTFSPQSCVWNERMFEDMMRAVSFVIFHVALFFMLFMLLYERTIFEGLLPDIDIWPYHGTRLLLIKYECDTLLAKEMEAISTNCGWKPKNNCPLTFLAPQEAQVQSVKSWFCFPFPF